MATLVHSRELEYGQADRETEAIKTLFLELLKRETYFSLADGSVAFTLAKTFTFVVHHLKYDLR